MPSLAAKLRQWAQLLRLAGRRLGGWLYRINPRLAHSLHQWKRSRKGVRPAVLSIATLPQLLPSPRPASRHPAGLEVDVIIPVYQGLAETRDCLHSVLADPQRLPGEVVVINDCSPDRELVAFLEELAQQGRIRLLNNPENLGFVVSVNRGMQAAGQRDVVLLNSDTRVPPGWTLRLAQQAYSRPKVASVTPLSNHATLASWPLWVNQTTTLPQGFSLEEVDAACQRANTGRQYQLPTAHGFCMYIRREALERVGLFDATTYGKGYGEENDFSLRASAQGWKHLLAPDVLVFHHGSTSFGSHNPSRQLHYQRLIERYPRYPNLVEHHRRQDPARYARWAVSLELLRHSRRPRVLFISHGMGGGTTLHQQALARQIAERADVVTLSSLDPDTLELATLSLPGLPHQPSLRVTNQAALLQLLRHLNFKRVYVHHWIGFEGRLDILRLLRDLNLPYDLHIRDFYAMCPRTTLSYRGSQEYCGELGIQQCHTCLQGSGLSEDIEQWRTHHTPLVLHAQRVLCASHDTLQRVLRYFPRAQALFVPHEPPPSVWPIHKPAWQPGQPLRIAMIGGISSIKGLGELELLAPRAQEAGIELSVIGYTFRPAPPQVTVLGKYQNADLPRLIEQHDPHLFWFPSQWPETYCWTLSAAIASGRPVAATRLGSFGERLEGRPQTWLQDYPCSTQDWLDTIAKVKAYLGNGEAAPTSPILPISPPFYPNGYLAPLFEEASPSPMDSSVNA